MKRKLLITGIVIGALLTLGPLWGMIGMALGMMGAFKTLSGDGISDPHALSGRIGLQLASGMAGLVACSIGIVLLAACMISLVLDKKQPPPLPPVS
jgi:hypothetical protein